MLPTPHPPSRQMVNLFNLVNRCNRSLLRRRNQSHTFIAVLFCNWWVCLVCSGAADLSLHVCLRIDVFVLCAEGVSYICKQYFYSHNNFWSAVTFEGDLVCAHRRVYHTVVYQPSILKPFQLHTCICLPQGHLTYVLTHDLDACNHVPRLLAKSWGKPRYMMRATMTHCMVSKVRWCTFVICR